MLRLLFHQWKEKTRSPFWQKSVILNIFTGFLGLLLLLEVVFIGLFADKIIEELYVGKNVIEVFTSLMFYYFSADLIVRFLLQKIPSLSIKPYLTLPIKKGTLLHYPLIISLISFFNLLPLLLITPFFIKVVCTSESFLFSFVWFLSLFAAILSNNYLNFTLKKYFSKRPLIILVLLFLVGFSLYIDAVKIVPLSKYFSSLIFALTKKPILAVIPVSIATLTYFISYFLLKRNSYIEELVTQRKLTGNFNFLSRYGQIGNLIRVEVKMILRNKRPRSMLMLSLVFLLYGFIFYKDENLGNNFILILTGVIITSMFAINYGQLSFSWESSYFDNYLSRQISPFNYIKSKYLIFAFSSISGYIITLPYILIDYKIGLINTAVMLYSIGISSVILLYFSTYNSSRIDLDKNQFMNYQGTGANQFLMVIPIMVFPILISLAFKYFGFPQYGFYALGIIGIIGIVFSKYLIQIVANQYVKRKYQLARNFRQR